MLIIINRWGCTSCHCFITLSLTVTGLFKLFSEFYAFLFSYPLNFCVLCAPFYSWINRRLHRLQETLRLFEFNLYSNWNSKRSSFTWHDKTLSLKPLFVQPLPACVSESRHNATETGGSFVKKKKKKINNAAVKNVNFEKCEETLMKTQPAHYLHVFNRNVSAHRWYHGVSRHARHLYGMDIVTLTRDDVTFNESTNVLHVDCTPNSQQGS